MYIPKQCHLWQKKILKSSDLVNAFEVVQTFADSNHFGRYIMKCKACGQLYLYEYREEVNWSGGDDKQYATYIPVLSHLDAQEVNNQSSMELLGLLRLQWDAPVPEGVPEAFWVRGLNEQESKINQSTQKI